MARHYDHLHRRDESMAAKVRKRRIHKTALAKRTIGEMALVALVMVMAAGTIVALAAIAWER